MKKKIPFLACLVATLVLALSATGCLKTRAQLKDEPQDEAASPAQPVKVQEVEPQGRYAIDEIKSEFTRLTGRVEDIERTQKEGAPGAPTGDQVKALEARIMELEKAQASMIEAIKKVEANAPVPDQKDLLDKGKQHFRAQMYEEAIESLSTYLKTPKPKHAEEATYYRAESYYATKQFKKAIADYAKFTEDFTKSPRMPQVLLRLGMSFEGIGSKEDAKAFFQELVDKFPNSSEAKKAKAKLK